MGNSVGCKRSVIDDKDEVKSRSRVSTVSTLSTGSEAPPSAFNDVTPENDDDNQLYIGLFQEKQADSGNDGVVRRAFHKLTPRDQDRVVAAMDRMMNDGTFFKHGSLHGWPSTFNNGKWGYCVHSYQRFCTWHREYLRGFELDMQRADRANGGDGNLGLPYWDWLESPSFPRKLQKWLEYPREGIPSRWRNFDRLRPEVRQRYVRNGTFDMRINTFVPDKSFEVRGSFQLGHFGQYSNKRGQKPGGFQDIESIHDSVHAALGGIVGELDIAAFHPAFWLHHCMIDRLFETYLFFEPDSMSEMSRSEINQRLEPFGTTSQRDFLWRHDGYRYDSIATAFVPRSVQQNTQMNMMMIQNPGYTPPKPTLTRLGESPEHHTNPTKFPPETNVSFRIDVKKLQGDSWPVKIFALPPGQRMDVPFNQPNTWRRSRWIVGDSGILHSRDITTCSACQDSEPFNFDVPIGRGLQRLGLSRNQVNYVIWFQNGAGQPFTAEDLYRRGIIGGHTITGPFFGDPHNLQIGVRSEDCKKLQLYLKVFGWYDGQIDGIFSEKTKAGVMGFQKFFGLKVDGLVGGRTKDFIINKFRMDDEEDTNGDVCFWPKGSRVTYKVMSAPQYLNREQLLREIDEAFDAWESFGNYDFVRVQWNQPADIEVSFQDHADFNILASEGRGGILARSDKNHIQFNEDEKWMLRNSQIPRLGGFYVYNVALHQVGKVIGLSNSPDPRDAMYPFYNATKTELHTTEQKAATSLLQQGRPMQAPHPRQSQLKKQVQKGTNDEIPLDTYAQQKKRWQQAPAAGVQVPAAQARPQSGQVVPAQAMPSPPIQAMPSPPIQAMPSDPITWDKVSKVASQPAPVVIQPAPMGMPAQPQPTVWQPVSEPMTLPAQASPFMDMPIIGQPQIVDSSCPCPPVSAFPAQPDFGGGFEEFKEQPMASQYNVMPTIATSAASTPYLSAASPQMLGQFPNAMSSTDEFTLPDAQPPAPTFMGFRGQEVDQLMASARELACPGCKEQEMEILSRPAEIHD